jgi:flagellar FliJ protein
MGFRFSLAAVLKYREQCEQREEQKLELLRDTLARLKTQLAAAGENLLRLQGERDLLLERGMLGDDLNYATEQALQMKSLEEELRKQMSTARVDYENQLQAFLAARQKREILDELKETKKETYRAQHERWEQQSIDEIFNARRHRDT